MTSGSPTVKADTPHRRLKVVQLNLQRHYAGGEVATLLLARGLVELGHEVTLVCPDSSLLHGKAQSAGVETRSLGARGQIDLAATWRLARMLRRIRPDIVHMHTAREFLIGCIAARLAGVWATIITRHLALPVKPLMRRVYRSGCDLVICAAGAVQRSLLEAGIAREQTVVIHEPVDAGAVRSGIIDKVQAKTELGLEPDVVVVGVVGSLIEAKGHRYFLQAAQQLVEAGFGGKFVLAGTGPLRDELEALSVELGVAEHVVFLGFRDDILQVISAFDIFVLPSIIGEAFPLAILEAMAAGIPVVGTRLSGIPEAIEDGQTGLLVEPRDAGGLASAMTRMLADAGLRERVVGRALVDVELYDYKVAAQRTETEYYRLLDL